MRSDLGNQLDDWDGKSADYLQRVFENHCDRENFFVELVAGSTNPDRQNAATWLLKRLLEGGFSPTRTQVGEFCRNLVELEHWESRLHVLQCLPYLQIPKRNRGQLQRFLECCKETDNKFVRAWTYSGRYELARHFPEFRSEVIAELEEALNNEAASVRARVRKVLAQGFD